MTKWWHALAKDWEWSNPTHLMGFVTILVTALILVILWRFGAKQAKQTKHGAVLNKLQTEILAHQEQILRRQRRDFLLEIVGRASAATHLGLLWREVGEYEAN